MKSKKNIIKSKISKIIISLLSIIIISPTIIIPTLNYSKIDPQKDIKVELDRTDDDKTIPFNETSILNLDLITATISGKNVTDKSVRWDFSDTNQLYEDAIKWNENNNTLSPEINLADSSLANIGEYKFIAKAISNQDSEISATYTFILTRKEVENSYITYLDESGHTQKINLYPTTANIKALESRSSSGSFDYNFDTNGDNNADTKISSEKLQNIVFGDEWLSVEELGNNFCSYMFYKRIDLTSTNVDFRGLNNVTKVGDNFCHRMFEYCTNLVNMDTEFNLPPNITTVGINFCFNIFYDCTNLEMNDVFNLPKNITEIGNDFCYGMFQNCINLVMNDVFNLPQNITAVGDRFCGQMFLSCSKLEMNDIFNLPPNITTVGTYFCFNMFRDCTILVMNEVFNLPPNITTVGDYFCFYIFSGCTDLVVNGLFNLPQGIITAINLFCYSMFFKCTNISSSSESGTSINFQHEAIYAFTDVSDIKYEAYNSKDEEITLIDGTVPAGTTVKILHKSN